MSANLDLVRSLYRDWSRGHYSSNEWAHPEIEFVIVGGPAPSSRTGVAGMAEGWRDVLNAWDDARSEVDEYRELDDERLLVLFRYIGRGKTSGLEIGETGAKGASVVHVRDGKVTRLVHYFDRDRALTDLGLTSGP